MLVCLVPALFAACGGGESDVPWYQQAGQQNAGLHYDGYHYDPDGYYYTPYDPDAYYSPPLYPDGYVYVYPTFPTVPVVVLATSGGAIFDAMTYPGVPYPGYADGYGYDGGPMAPGPCAGPLCVATNTKALLIELTGTLSATSECPLAKPGFSGLHATSWCEPSEGMPRGELAQMCARCCPAACQALGTQLRTGSDGGTQDTAAALLVFKRGCTLNGGSTNCLQANAIVLDMTPPATNVPMSTPDAFVPDTH